MLSKTLLSLTVLALSAFAAPTPHSEPESRQACSDVFVYFARGTTEVLTLGTVVGPGFSANLGVKLAARGMSLTFEGVPYPATVVGYLTGGDEGGANTMAASVMSTASRCPNAKIVISGYSQGAQVTHKAAAKLSSSVQGRVVAAVTFGDPDQRDAYPGVINSRKLIFCNAGDLICLGQPVIFPPHLAYGANVGEASDFVVAHV
ncbi:Cutinase [Leucoagaricus sp. SymC.cos]|nr:Cutinase [Leucoagaricus sp. SymC.cos]